MIPFVDLKAQHEELSDELEAVALDVLRSGHYVMGPRVASFESDFAAYCGSAHAIALNTGTSALHLALLALDISSGDEVITTPMTFVATAAAILYANATPVLVDIDSETWTMDPLALEAAITSRTKAIIPVHLHGRLADMGAILAIAQRHGVPVIEDAAQAHGAERDGRRAGTFGRIGCFSFYPSKNLGACGEGGAVVTDDPTLAARMRLLRDWGQNGKHNHVVHGYNYRMDELQAGLLSVKLRHLDDWTKRRRKIATYYGERLKASDDVSPPLLGGKDHVYHVYAVRSRTRDDLRDKLRGRGIDSAIHYPVPVHLQKAYNTLGYDRGDMPRSERLAEELLSLPLYPQMSDSQAEQVCSAIMDVG